jgi:hypothetical protein
MFLGFCGLLRAQTALDQSSAERALSASVFATPTPPETAMIPKEFRMGLLQLSGSIIQKLGVGAYIIRPEVGCAVNLGIPIVAISGSGADAVYQAEPVLLRGEPTAKSGQFVVCMVKHSAPYRYAPSPGNFVKLEAFQAAEFATPKPNGMEEFFGPNTQMQESVLDQVPYASSGTPRPTRRAKASPTP